MMGYRSFALALLATVLPAGIFALGQHPERSLPAGPTDLLSAQALPPPTEPALTKGAETSLPPAVFLPGDQPPSIPPAASPPTDDPVQTVQAFVDRNRKEAEDSIASLTKEAETLRARLERVEAALERWKAVEQAFKQEPAKAANAAGKARWERFGSGRRQNPAEVAPLLEPVPSEVPIGSTRRQNPAEVAPQLEPVPSALPRR
jgi:hypothetical protein